MAVRPELRRADLFVRNPALAPWVGILPLPDGLAINAMCDGYRMDKFFRFNESLQRFCDLSASIDTTFAVASPA